MVGDCDVGRRATRSARVWKTVGDCINRPTNYERSPNVFGEYCSATGNERCSEIVGDCVISRQAVRLWEIVGDCTSCRQLISFNRSPLEVVGDWDIECVGCIEIVGECGIGRQLDCCIRILEVVGDWHSIVADGCRCRH